MMTEPKMERKKKPIASFCTVGILDNMVLIEKWQNM